MDAKVKNRDQTAFQPETNQLSKEEGDPETVTSKSLPLSVQTKRCDALEARIIKDMENLMNTPLLRRIQQSQDSRIAAQKSNSQGGPEQDRDPLIDDTNKENQENEKMPFGFLKKKETAPEVQASKPEAEAADGKTTKSDDVIENGETAKKSTTPSVEDTSKVSVDKTDKDGNAAVSFTTSTTEGTDGAEVKEEVQPTKTGTKTEKSPLIEADAVEAPGDGKDSKVRDHSPGFLCCTIL